MSRPDEPPVDLVAVYADDELVEDLRGGQVPAAVEATDAELAAMLAAWRRHVVHDDGPSTEAIIAAYQQRSRRRRWSVGFWALASSGLGLALVTVLVDLPPILRWALLAAQAVMVVALVVGELCAGRRERAR